VDDWGPYLIAGAIVAVVIAVGIVLLAVAFRRTARQRIPIRFTPHAAERMAERNVRDDDVRKALARPSRVLATTYVDRGNASTDVSSSDREERDSLRIEKDFRGRMLKVWVPTDWRSSRPIVVKSVAWLYRATLRVSPGRVGVIIGRGGETIKNLQQVYDVRVHVERLSGVVRIAGDDKDAVNRARRRVQRLVGS
jgi:predicted RNA-binding protein YlqC (UPF0109 family)